jgi:hypothetical protein
MDRLLFFLIPLAFLLVDLFLDFKGHELIKGPVDEFALVVFTIFGVLTASMRHEPHPYLRGVDQGQYRDVPKKKISIPHIILGASMVAILLDSIIVIVNVDIFKKSLTPTDIAIYIVLAVVVIVSAIILIMGKLKNDN